MPVDKNKPNGDINSYFQSRSRANINLTMKVLYWRNHGSALLSLGTLTHFISRSHPIVLKIPKPSNSRKFYKVKKSDKKTQKVESESISNVTSLHNYFANKILAARSSNFYYIFMVLFP